MTADDPRFAGLPAALVEKAREAHCARCEVQLVEAASMIGSVMVNYYMPAIDARARVFLCGMCGLVFREFMTPSLVGQPDWVAVKTELQKKWSER
jgi:hypothetical protein